MYLKDDYLIIELDHTCQLVSFHDRNPRYVLDPDAITGFFDAPGTKRNNTVRPTSWGDFNEPGYKSARLMTVTGTAVANTAKELQAMRDNLMSVFSDGKLGPVKVINSSSTRTSWATVEGTPRWQPQTDTVATFKVDLYAPDPRLYGIEKRITLPDLTLEGGLDFRLNYPLDFGGPNLDQAEAVFNYGNVDAWPKFVVTGDYFLGFEISNGNSKRIRYEGIVTHASPVTIDMGAGTAIQNNTDKSNLLTRRDWFSIPSYSSIQPKFYPIQKSSGWCDIIYNDTWI